MWAPKKVMGKSVKPARIEKIVGVFGFKPHFCPNGCKRKLSPTAKDRERALGNPVAKLAGPQLKTRGVAAKRVSHQCDTKIDVFESLMAIFSETRPTSDFNLEAF